jgi:hypothetical protein
MFICNNNNSYTIKNWYEKIVFNLKKISMKENNLDAFLNARKQIRGACDLH